MQSGKGESKNFNIINISWDFLDFLSKRERKELNAQRANRLRTIVYCRRLSLQFVFQVARRAIRKLQADKGN